MERRGEGREGGDIIILMYVWLHCSQIPNSSMQHPSFLQKQVGRCYFRGLVIFFFKIGFLYKLYFSVVTPACIKQ